MKIERKYLAHYIRVGEQFERLGRDLEEFTPELAANVAKSRNILGEDRVNISGYEKTAAVEPIYAERDTALFDHLQAIIDQQYVLEDLKTEVVDVKLWETAQGDDYPAVWEEAYIEVTSYGGDHSGYRIGFKLHYTGVKKQGLFNISDKTFMELGA